MFKLNKLSVVLIPTLALVSLALAQPQFKAEHCFQVGDNSKIGFAVFMESFESNVAKTGSNYTWDFSGTGWAAPTASYVFQPGSKTEHTLLGNSQINEYAILSFSRDLFYSYSAGKDTLYYDGLYASTSILNKPPYPYLTFPLNFGDSVYYNGKLYGHPTQPNTPLGSVTRSWIYDGFGTVKLPYGTYENVYRIRTMQIDSSYLFKLGVPSEELIWFRQSDGIPVLRFLKNATLISAYFASTPSSASIHRFIKSGGQIPGIFGGKLDLSSIKENIKSIQFYTPNGELSLSISRPKTSLIDNDLQAGMYSVVINTDREIIRKVMLKN